MDLQAVGCGGLDYIDVAQYKDGCCPLVDAVLNIRVP